MPVAGGVIHDGFFLDALLGDGVRNADNPVRTGRRGERGDFEGVQRLARVAIRDGGEECERVGVGDHRSRAGDSAGTFSPEIVGRLISPRFYKRGYIERGHDAALIVRERAAQHGLDVGGCERFELEDL